MASAKPPLFIALFSCMSKDVDSYTKASVNKLRELLIKHHDKSIERRWTFECLADFEEEGLIYRQVRTKRRPDGTIRRLSSIIKFHVKGLRKLVKMRVEGSLLALKNKITHIKNKYGIRRQKLNILKKLTRKWTETRKGGRRTRGKWFLSPFLPERIEYA